MQPKPTPRLSRPGKSTLFVLLLLPFVLNCKTIVGNVSCLRNMFYPPRAGDMRGLPANTAGESFAHADFDALLKKYVSDAGQVNYGELKKNDEPALDLYLTRLEKLGAEDFTKLGLHEQLALLINAYNAFTLKLILEFKGVASIRDIPAAKRWKDQRWEVAGKTVGLEELEHKWIRPQYGEPRIHFALVCAAISCPKLRNEAYRGESLEAQLNDQTKHYFSLPGNFRWDKGDNTIHFSDLIDWYRGDFESHSGSLAKYVSPFISRDLAAEIKVAGDKVTYTWLTYNWALNGSW